MTLAAGGWTVVGESGYYQLTVTDSSQFIAGAASLLRYITGADFAEITPCDGLAFTANQCALTVTKDGSYIVSAEFSVFGNTGWAVTTFDLNGDVVDTAPSVGVNVAPCANVDVNHYAFVSVTRIFKNLSAGDIIRPVALFAGVFGALVDMTIDQFSMIAQPLGETQP